MTDDNQPTRPRKKRYERPELRKVPLRPQEAVLGGCKTASIAGPGNSACSTVSCMSLGS